ncbi:MAG: dicarboxylate/amino acid:cation symporter [Planctomycetaceae bacterium]|nr:dicarboxylate/amino acid:cation symporter [Planctomycetaceae bacterium]
MSEAHHQPHLTKWIILAIVLAIVLAMALPIIAAMGVSQADIEAAAESNASIAAHLEAGRLEEATSEYIAQRAAYLIEPLKLGGDIFLRVLKMIVVPLVVASVMTGILGMGDVRKLGKPGLYTVLYYLSTTFLAVVVGLIVVNIVRPGVAFGEGNQQEVSEAKRPNQTLYEHLGKETKLSDDQIAKLFGDSDYVERKDRSMGRIFRNLVLMLFTDNLFESAVGTQLLPLIVFSIAFAGMLTTMGEQVSTLKSFIYEMNNALMVFILLIMRVAPIGIFCLVAGRFGEANANGEFFAELSKTGWYSASVVIGLGIHSFVTLPILLYVFTKRNPYRFMVQMGQALLTAFSTASSSATLPLTMEAAVDEAGISKQSVDFVLPLGATINMDGTALYEAVAAIFIAQVVGADLSFAQQVTVALTATLAAIGAAGIPEAGLVTMVIVLTAVGLPVEYITIILSVDWLLDRFRTTVNVFGDACGAAIVEKSMPAADAAS